jgi:hypothetical protein
MSALDLYEYNPDLIAIDRADTHWLIEVKMDKEMSSTDVKGKRGAARRWANYVNADEQVWVTSVIASSHQCVFLLDDTEHSLDSRRLQHGEGVVDVGHPTRRTGSQVSLH